MASLTWPGGIELSPTDFAPGFTPNGEIVQINRHGYEHLTPGVMLRTASMSFDIRAEDTYHRLLTLVSMLGGASRTIKVPWFIYTAKLGSGTGSPTVSGAHQAGAQAVATTGWTGSDPRLSISAMVSFGDPPFVYNLQGTINGSSPTMLVTPPLRTDVSSGAAITYAPDPVNGVWLVTTMRLRNSADVYGSLIAPHLMQGLMLEFVESLRAAY